MPFSSINRSSICEGFVQIIQLHQGFAVFYVGYRLRLLIYIDWLYSLVHRDALTSSIRDVIM